ncbi:hypothetical protein AVEN_131283-1, partial [Araneus ventricosus]
VSGVVEQAEGIFDAKTSLRISFQVCQVVDRKTFKRRGNHVSVKKGCCEDVEKHGETSNTWW